jgi:hypothetical protein
MGPSLGLSVTIDDLEDFRVLIKTYFLDSIEKTYENLEQKNQLSKLGLMDQVCEKTSLWFFLEEPLIAGIALLEVSNNTEGIVIVSEQHFEVLNQVSKFDFNEFFQSQKKFFLENEQDVFERQTQRLTSAHNTLKKVLKNAKKVAKKDLKSDDKKEYLN